jgi:hypothetical protein
MFRAFPWMLSIVLTIAFAASFSELQRMRTKLGEVTRHTFHDHKDVREFMIRAVLAEATNPIVVIGDSITEMAPLPVEAYGHQIINAGIGSMRTVEFAPLARHLFSTTRPPHAIVVAFGANDRSSPTLREDYGALLAELQQYTTRLISISDTAEASTNDMIRDACRQQSIDYIEPTIPAEGKIDGIHYNRIGYQIWIAALMQAIDKIVPTSRESR